MTVRLIIIDCDGTLVDSEPLGNQAFAEVLTENGFQISACEAERRFRGMKLATCLESITEESGVTFPETFEKQFRSRMAEKCESSLQPIDGAESLLSGLMARYCIASSGPKTKICNSLRITGLSPYFSENIFSSYEVGIWKPDPGFFGHIANAYEVEPSECIVIEDSLPGITAGVNCGMHVWAYAPGGTQSDWPLGIRVFSKLSGIQDEFQNKGLWAPNNRFQRTRTSRAAEA